MVKAYLHSALWCSPTPDDAEHEHLDAWRDLEHYTPEAVIEATVICQVFYLRNARLLTAVNPDMSQHGHDLWLTRNHHGAGFWDRGYPQIVGDLLTAEAEALGERFAFAGVNGEVEFDG